MKIPIYVILGVFLALTSHAQTFHQKDSVIYSGLFDANGQVADFNHDGDLDYVFFAEDSLGISAFLLWPDTYRLDTIEISELKNKEFFMADINNDQKLDILTTTVQFDSNRSVIYYQLDSMEFTTEVLDSVVIARADFPDFHNDGQKEIVYSTADHQLKVRRLLGNVWQDLLDTTQLHARHSWVVYDADRDGWKDLLVNSLEADTVHTHFYRNDEGLLIKVDSTFGFPSPDHLQEVDVNNDGHPDLLNAGNVPGEGFQMSIFRRDTSFTIALFPAVKDFEVFSADLNSDGWVDFYLSANTVDSTDFTQLFINEGDDQFLPSDISDIDSVLSSSFGDIDFDGDLDLLQVILNDSLLQIKLLNNISPDTNNGPDIVSQYYAFSTPHGLILWWESTTDDHTPDAAITYDVFVGTDLFTADMMAGNFSLKNTKRFLPSPGGIGSNDQVWVADLPAGAYEYGIQSVDNSFHYRANGSDGSDGFDNCYGRALACGTFEICSSRLFETRYACKGESLTLALGYKTAWYSVKKGFLGVQDSVHLYADVQDTIYTAANNCDQATDFIIRVIENEELLAMADTALCKDALLSLEVAGADSLKWFSEQTFLSDSSNLIIKVLKDQTIYVEAYFNHCLFRDSAHIQVSVPEMQDFDDEFKVIKGESLEFQFSPAYTYGWLPEIWVSNAEGSNPVISPRSSLSYSVTAFDSLGCAVSDTIYITVVDQGWIPDLFTPNNDGNNDLLKIYGLENVREFSFSVYSRSGNLVYHTENIAEIIGGWDGTKSGQPLPNGVYIWKVYGVLDDQSTALLNGAKSGTVYIIR